MTGEARLYFGGEIHTVDPARPRAEAVGVRSGRIVAVGSERECRTALGEHFSAMDLRGRALLPGFIDTHLHPVMMVYYAMNADLAGLRNLQLIFEGGEEDVDLFEVSGVDMGPILAGLDLNFALGTLTLGGADVGKLQLVNFYDNQPGWVGQEVLYVEDLYIGPGSHLNLGGINLYYLSGTIDPAAIVEYHGGQLTRIPEPGMAFLIATGALVLLRRRR